ncbi:MAG: LacI family transcriptional regulator [Fusobacteriaceae bacterium]|jgi:LacI family transcriptional regulator|nr:LacI family transcriptional regulator [Fusobacteriaceae bacterium]
MKKKYTIADVADLAGVSKTTVSNVLNNIENKFTEETKAKVLNAMEKLDFNINFGAKSLSEGKSYLIGVILPIYKDTDILQENFFLQEFLSGINRYLNTAKNKYDIIFTGVNESKFNVKNWIRKRNIDGVICFGLTSNYIYEYLEKLKIPTVIVDDLRDVTNGFSRIFIADKKGGYLATKYLIENGHKDIAFINTGINLSKVEKNRFNGYIEALSEYNLDFYESNCFELKYIHYDSGVYIADKIKDLIGKKFTAAFVTSDIIAIGLINRLQELGVKIPNDFSIVGFDNISLSKYIYPKLTTIDQNIHKKGQSAAEELIKIIEHDNIKKNIEMDVSLVIRESVKNIKE